MRQQQFLTLVGTYNLFFRGATSNLGDEGVAEQSFILQVGSEGAFGRLLDASIMTLVFSRMIITISFTLTYIQVQEKKIVTKHFNWSCFLR